MRPHRTSASRPTACTEIAGILNGTTNFMLTKMVRGGHGL
ncbi:MAG: hypothetical protein ACLVJH_11300 [Faecalibacterium prausnitzii]